MDPGPPNDQSTSNVDGQPYGRPGTPDDECLGRSTRGPDRRGRSRIAVRIVRVDGTVGLRGYVVPGPGVVVGVGFGVVVVVGVVSTVVLDTVPGALAASTDTGAAGGGFTLRKINTVSSVVTTKVTAIAIRLAIAVHRHRKPDS